MNNIKTIKMRYVVLIILLILSNHSSAQTDFSGKWKIDTSQSVIPKQASTTSVSTELDISQQQNSISITRYYSGVLSSSETLSFDGTPLVTEKPNGKRTAVLQWQEDKKSLLQQVKFERATQDSIANTGTTHTLTLSDDRKLLTVLSVYGFPGNKFLKVQAVYTKQ